MDLILNIKLKLQISHHKLVV